MSIDNYISVESQNGHFLRNLNSIYPKDFKEYFNMIMQKISDIYDI